VSVWCDSYQTSLRNKLESSSQSLTSAVSVWVQFHLLMNICVVNWIGNWGRQACSSLPGFLCL
jgi:hypothetical protein